MGGIGGGWVDSSGLPGTTSRVDHGHDAPMHPNRPQRLVQRTGKKNMGLTFSFDITRFELALFVLLSAA